MGMSIKSGSGGGRRRRSKRHAPMSEINVTPFVDVMLVLLIIFMVAAPLLTVGVPLELPQSKGEQLQSSGEPLVISVAANGEVSLQDKPITLDEIPEQLRKVAKSGYDDPVFVRGDKGISYGVILQVMGRITSGGFKKVSLVSEVEEGG